MFSAVSNPPGDLYDTHAHLACDELAPRRDELLARAAAAGVGWVLCVTEHPAETRRALDLAADCPSLGVAAGLHPDRAASLTPDAFLAELDDLETLARREVHRLCALGEVGLDYWRAQDEPQRELQRLALRRIVRLARELDLPLSVHSRSAGRQTIELLRSEGASRVVLHAFDGRAATAQAGLDAGYLFSFPPSLLRSPQKQKLARRLPPEALLLESDSPVLGPDPGLPNEPANIPLVLAELARIHGLAPELLARGCARRSRAIFGLGG